MAQMLPFKKPPTSDVIVIDPRETDNDNEITASKITDEGTLEIETDDGGVVIDFNPQRFQAKEDGNFGSNLVDKIDPMELSRIGMELIQAIQSDDESRSQWLEDRARGIDLLGLKLERPSSDVSADGGGLVMSKVRDPILLEACIRFMANASAELLPAAGPVKVRNDGGESTDADKLAETLERDMNAYLTTTESSYYPDTKRMLLMTGFGGSGFKKVYHDPIKNRPVSVAIDAKDLIVSNNAIDLASASRVTHQLRMRKSVLKRMQILGVYRNIDLHTPTPTKSVVDQKMSDVTGVRENADRPEDNDYEIYECYCELDIEGLEHSDKKGDPTGLPLPYRVTIEKSSMQVLEITRNWSEEDDEFPVAKKVFVKYGYIEGFGFYGIGLLHILGNMATAITAGIREMLDAGMLANFPGFIYLQTAGGKQMTNNFRVPAGGGAAFQGNSQQKLQDQIMALPYKEAGPAMQQLVASLREVGQRVGGTAEVGVGEGRQNAPVGTTLALIEQATKVEGSVHKGLHQSQSEELRLFKDLFSEDPESLWRYNKKLTGQWDEAKLRQALQDHDLVPCADPNTPSHMHRLMKLQGLKTLQGANPQLYDAKAVDTAALEMMGFDNPAQFFAPPQAPAETPIDPNMAIIAAKTETEKMKIITTSKDKAADRESKLLIEKLKLAGNLAVHPTSQGIVSDTLGIPLGQPQTGLPPGPGVH